MSTIVGPSSLQMNCLCFSSKTPSIFGSIVTSMSSVTLDLSSAEHYFSPKALGPTMYFIKEWTTMYFIMERPTTYFIMERPTMYLITERPTSYFITKWTKDFYLHVIDGRIDQTFLLSTACHLVHRELYRFVAHTCSLELQTQ